MRQTEILNELRKLSAKERLEIIEAVIHLLQEDIQKIEHPPIRIERKGQLAVAAKALLLDYKEDDELIIFTTLDGQNFHAQR